MTGSQGVPLLEVENLTTLYPVRRGLADRVARQPRLWVHAVDGVSFTLARGEMLALVGESGCGKTTTAQTILGMVAPASGTVRLNGTDIVGMPERQMRPLRRQLQMIYQDPTNRSTRGSGWRRPSVSPCWCTESEANRPNAGN